MNEFDIARRRAMELIDGAVELFDLVMKSRNPRSSRRMKGLAFVEMYAAYERSIHDAVRLYLVELRDADVEIKKVSRPLLALLQSPDIQSISERSNNWDRRVKLFEQSTSGRSGDINTELFPKDNSHYRKSQLEVIWRVLCLKGPTVPSGRLFPFIIELVENRNAIAHGRKESDEVGRTYTTADIRTKFRQTSRICIHIITACEDGARNQIAIATS